MKKQLFTLTVLIVSVFFFASCSKQNDAGIQIDGNGKPGSGNQSRTGTSLTIPVRSAGSCIDPNGKDTAMSEYGIAIDPDGRR